jgi:four helix bundle protein
MAVQYVRDLIAWQKGIDLVESVYVATRTWPREELYGLTSQIRRAAVSVPSNIAEGQGRFGTNEFVHHLGIAHGSLMEVFTQVTIAERLAFMQKEQTTGLVNRIEEESRIINGLVGSLRAREPRKR